MSYKQLPVHLKPCFLYMGVFGEDKVICRSTLVKLWVAEGFLKPLSGKSLEEAAKAYLKELADRNLVLINEVGIDGEIKCCMIHDLLRDLCLGEAETERFHRVIGDDLVASNSRRHVVFPRLFTREVLESLSHTRSIICHYNDYGEVRLPNNLRLLRTFKAHDQEVLYGHFLDDLFELVNSRYLDVSVQWNSRFPTSVELLWNLQTLIVHCYYELIAPIEIWKLHQLRHLESDHEGLILPDPPSGDSDMIIMENLQTLKVVRNLILNEEVVKRIPNVKKLHLSYDEEEQMGKRCLSYLQCLSKLENFRCSTNKKCDEYWQMIRFPHSLKKLYVYPSSELELEDIMPKIGSLPNLEKFELRKGFFKASKWETIEGQFSSLKFLKLVLCCNFKDWIVSDNSHFPLLQKLCLSSLDQLKEIPSEVGEIATLKSIELNSCSESVWRSAKKIVEEQEDLYGDQLDLHVRVEVDDEHEELKSLANANFEVVVFDMSRSFDEMEKSVETPGFKDIVTHLAGGYVDGTDFL